MNDKVFVDFHKDLGVLVEELENRYGIRLSYMNKGSESKMNDLESMIDMVVELEKIPYLLSKIRIDIVRILVDGKFNIPEPKVSLAISKCLQAAWDDLKARHDYNDIYKIAFPIFKSYEIEYTYYKVNEEKIHTGEENPVNVDEMLTEIDI